MNQKTGRDRHHSTPNHRGEMALKQKKSAEMDVLIPDKKSLDQAMKRTTHLVVAAHQDDIEIMAYHAISECYHSSKKWMTGVTLTNGGGSPRTGKYKNYSAEKMKVTRRGEQRKAAKLGRYGLMIQMGFESSDIKSKTKRESIETQLTVLFLQCQPDIVYTHNLSDKRDTHVAVAFATIKAICNMPKNKRPKRLLGCEVWRDLDWLVDEQKVVLPVSRNPKLASKLCRVFDSQISGGKRYDIGAIGRRSANATFFESSKVDQETHVSFAMDLTPLIVSTVNAEQLVSRHISEFRNDVLERLKRLKKPKGTDILFETL